MFSRSSGGLMLLLIISFFSFFLCWLEEEIDGVEMSYLQILSVDAEQKRLKDLVIAATRFVTSLIINLFNFLICNYYSMTRTVSILFWLGIRHWNGGTYMLIDKDIIKLWRKCVNIIPTFLVKCRYTLDLWFLALKLSPKIQINRPNTSELLGNTNFQFFFYLWDPQQMISSPSHQCRFLQLKKCLIHAFSAYCNDF